MFTDKNAFLSSVPPGSAVAINDWESDAPGVIVQNGTAICEATLSYDLQDSSGQPLQLEVFDFHDATTPTNYVGPSNPAGRLGLFLPGDAVALTFDPPAEALGVQFIGCPGTTEGVFHITATIGASQFTADTGPLTTTLSDDSEPYFLGIITDPGDTVSDAIIFSDEGLFSFSLDEIVFQCTVPELIDGDVNLDGLVNLDDVPAFVDVLLYYADPCDVATADLNNDGTVNGLDIQSFVALVT